MSTGYNPSVIDFLIRARTGTQLGCRTVAVVGKGPVTTSNLIIDPLGSTIIPPSGTITLVSTSTADASAGTGAQTVAVTGVNSSNVEVTEVITMNGTTPVASTTSFIGINNLNVATAGSGRVNAGDIACGSGVGDIHMTMEATISTSKTAIFTLQDTERALALGFNISCSTSASVLFELKVVTPGTVDIIDLEMYVSGDTFITISNLQGGPAPENTRIEMYASLVQPGLSATVNLLGFLLVYEHGIELNALRLPGS